MTNPLYDRLQIYLLMAAFLLVAGIYGLVRRRTLIGMLISGELIFSAASLRLGSWRTARLISALKTDANSDSDRRPNSIPWRT